MQECCANCFHYLIRTQACMKFNGMKPHPNYRCAQYEPLKKKPMETPKRCLTEDCPYQEGDPCIAAEGCGGFEGV